MFWFRTIVMQTITTNAHPVHSTQEEKQKNKVQGQILQFIVKCYLCMVHYHLPSHISRAIISQSVAYKPKQNKKNKKQTCSEAYIIIR